MHSLDPTEDFAIRLLRRFLLLCEHPRTRARMLGMVRNSTRFGPGAPKLYSWINKAVLHPRFMPISERRAMSTMKAELVASQLIGLAMTRYVLRLEPLASASVDEVVRLAAPSIRAALQGEDGFTALVDPAKDRERPALRALPSIRGSRIPGVDAVLRRVAPGRARV